MKEISSSDLDKFEKLLQRCMMSLQNRDKLVMELYDKMETGLVMLGATAVEDKLQDGVQHTLQALRQAGISVWILTGDKKETAVNISVSSGHLSPDMNLVDITDNDLSSSGLLTKLQSFHDQVKHSPIKSGLIVDGETLSQIFKNSKTSLLFINVRIYTIEPFHCNSLAILIAVSIADKSLVCCSHLLQTVSHAEISDCQTDEDLSWQTSHCSSGRWGK